MPHLRSQSSALNSPAAFRAASARGLAPQTFTVMSATTAKTRRACVGRQRAAPQRSLMCRRRRAERPRWRRAPMLARPFPRLAKVELREFVVKRWRTGVPEACMGRGPCHIWSRWLRSHLTLPLATVPRLGDSAMRAATYIESVIQCFDVPWVCACMRNHLAQAVGFTVLSLRLTLPRGIRRWQNLRL